MTRLAEIHVHIDSMDALQDIVGAMRSLAGMRVREAQNALPGIRGYAAAMADAVGAAVRLVRDGVADGAPRRGRRAVVICAAEHGFVGGFNDRLAAAAIAALAPGDAVFVLGSRGAALLAERRGPVLWTRPMATRVAGVPQSIARLTAALYDLMARGAVARVEVIFARYRTAGAGAVEQKLLLPLDLRSLDSGPARQSPLHTLEPRRLIESLVAEYVFALLTEAAVESIASENAARFAAMEAAHENVSKTLDKLRHAAHAARQDEITTELMDLVTGAEAMAQG